MKYELDQLYHTILPWVDEAHAIPAAAVMLIHAAGEDEVDEDVDEDDDTDEDEDEEALDDDETADDDEDLDEDEEEEDEEVEEE